MNLKVRTLVIKNIVFKFIKFIFKYSLLLFYKGTICTPENNVKDLYRLFEYLKTESNHEEKERSKYAQQYLRNLGYHANEKTSDNNLIRYCWYGADIFYVPSKQLRKFHWLSSLFARYNVRLANNDGNA